jgi:hypothetical protein
MTGGNQDASQRLMKMNASRPPCRKDGKDSGSMDIIPVHWKDEGADSISRISRMRQRRQG